MKKSSKHKNKFNPRDFIGFILFILIIGAMFYAIGNSSPNVVFICLTVLAIIILLFWLSPTITELMFSSKDTKLKLKQKGSA